MALAPNKLVLALCFSLSPIARDGFGGIAQNQLAEWLSPARLRRGPCCGLVCRRAALA